MELNREQIIKALECCITNSEMDCKNCPYRGIVTDLYDGCVNTLVKDALAIIKELTEENERLRAEGEWLPQFEGARIVKCSVCGYEYCDLIECGNYCGNCGAKMKGGE